MPQQHYDVIIIGTGAGGGTMARALALTGRALLILERGASVPVEPRTGAPKRSGSSCATGPASNG
jgi:choline dehydrogenase-like flavoprotein